MTKNKNLSQDSSASSTRVFNNPVAMWDFRLNVRDTKGNEIKPEDISTGLKVIAKHYVFQKEQGEKTGYEHYQGRLSLIKKSRKQSLTQTLNKVNIPTPNYLAPTNRTSFGEWFYVLKEETRIEGPWTEQDEETFIPDYVKNIKNLRPFQAKILESKDIKDNRIVNVIYDPVGQSGKSAIAAYCELFHNGLELPPVNSAEQVIQSIHGFCSSRRIRNPNFVFMDMPRAMNKYLVKDIYCALEQIKNGKLYDHRYQYRTYWINPPQIWVFTNTLPDIHLLSKDRWRFWTIDKNYELISLDYDQYKTYKQEAEMNAVATKYRLPTYGKLRRFNKSKEDPKK